MAASQRSVTRLTSIAASTALDNSAEFTGLQRTSIAPAFIALTVARTSEQSVMMMVGVLTCVSIWRARSTSLALGTEISSSRQHGASGRGNDRHSARDLQLSTANPL